MNILAGDSMTKQPATPITPSIDEKMDKYFNLGLFNDTSNVWDKLHERRQYYTMPSTSIPDGRDEWAKWCFQVNGSCRDGDMNYCLRYDNILYP